MMQRIRRSNRPEAVNLSQLRTWSAPPHAFVTYSIQDAKGKISVTKINFPVAVDIGVLRNNFVPTTATLINALILGKIVSAGVGLEVDLSGATIRATPDVNSDVEEGAYWPFEAANGAEAGFRIATFDESKFIAGTKLVDGSDTDAIAFRDRILAGQTVSLTNVSPSTEHGDDLTYAGPAYEQFKSSRGKK